jgi:hypothetical protein
LGFLEFLQRCDAHAHPLGVARKFIEFFAFEGRELRDFISRIACRFLGGAGILLSRLLRLRRPLLLRNGLLRRSLSLRRWILHGRLHGGARFYGGKRG